MKMNAKQTGHILCGDFSNFSWSYTIGYCICSLFKPILVPAIAIVSKVQKRKIRLWLYTIGE